MLILIPWWLKTKETSNMSQKFNSLFFVELRLLRLSFKKHTKHYTEHTLRLPRQWHMSSEVILVTTNQISLYWNIMYIWLQVQNISTKPTYIFSETQCCAVDKSYRWLALIASLTTSYYFLLSLLHLSSYRIVLPRPGWEWRFNYGNRNEARVLFKSLFRLSYQQREKATIRLRKQTPLSSYHKYGLPLDSNKPVSFIASINGCAFQITSGAPKPWGCLSPFLLAQLVAPSDFCSQVTRGEEKPLFSDGRIMAELSVWWSDLRKGQDKQDCWGVESADSSFISMENSRAWSWKTWIYEGILKL